MKPCYRLWEIFIFISQDAPPFVKFFQRKHEHVNIFKPYFWYIQRKTHLKKKWWGIKYIYVKYCRFILSAMHHAFFAIFNLRVIKCITTLGYSLSFPQILNSFSHYSFKRDLPLHFITSEFCNNIPIFRIQNRFLCTKVFAANFH